MRFCRDCFLKWPPQYPEIYSKFENEKEKINRYFLKCPRSPSFQYIGCSFKIFLKVGAEESIVNTQSKNKRRKSEVGFKDLIRDP
jgi:hypothetical protein